MPSATHYSRERYVTKQGYERGVSASDARYQQSRSTSPASLRPLLIAGAIAIVLVALIIVRFVLFGPVAGEYGEVKGQIDQNQAQIAELADSTATMQAQIDEMQPLIDQYNASGKK